MTAVNVSMRDMLEAGVHFGHQTRYWNPKMAPFIYGIRHNIHIINLEESLPMFRDALKVVHDVAARRGKILFVGTKHAAREVVREEAQRAGMPYIDYRWLGGMLTNYKTIRQSIKRLKDLEERLSNEDNLAGLTKKEVLNLMRARDKLHVNLSGIKNMGGLPDLIFVIDVGMEKIAIQEAQRLGIPVIGVADTNADPHGINYLIPGNDDAVRAIRFYCKTFADVIIEARGASDLVEAKFAGEEGADAEPKKVVTKRKPAVKKAAASKNVTTELSDAE
jgi:small subunit ribosomal protein S2